MTFDEASLTVSGDELLFYESRAKVLSARQIGPQEVELEMDFSGEGQTWRSIRRFHLSPDGRELADVTSGRQFVRVRCEQNPLPFVDEAPSDADFLAFRNRMLDAVANKDADYVLSVVTENILVSFGGDGGVEELTTAWRLDP